MEQEIEIDVMIADASHEVYVDTILDTIESAAKSGARVSPNVRTSMWPRR
mgnify:CR=1 FL=1